MLRRAFAVGTLCAALLPVATAGAERADGEPIAGAS